MASLLDYIDENLVSESPIFSKLMFRKEEKISCLWRRCRYN